MAGYDFGLDTELRLKREALYDSGLEDEVRKWIKSVTGYPLSGRGPEDFLEDLKDGIVLCELANKLQPGTIKKINKMKMPFMQMENIGFFLTAAKNFGVPSSDVFMTVDLYEKKNPNQVLQTLVSLGRCAQRIKGYSGPTIGAKLSDKREVQFSEEKVREAKAAGSRQTTGFTGGANQAGMRFGNRREIGGKERNL